MRWQVCAFLVLTMFLLFPSFRLEADETLRIWPLGDSITRGKERSGTLYPSYRRDLYDLLTDAGYDFNFVGTREGCNNDHGYDGFNTNFPLWLDQDHDGWGSHTSDDLLKGDYNFSGVSNVVGQIDPDIVLLHIGTNDAVYYDDPNVTTDNIKGIIDDVRSHNPNARFYVARIIPSSSSNAYHDEIDTISAAIAAEIPSMHTQQSPVTVVDLHAGYDLTWFSDGVHPDFDGEAFMAQRWAETIVPEPMTLTLLLTGLAFFSIRRPCLAEGKRAHTIP